MVQILYDPNIQGGYEQTTGLITKHLISRNIILIRSQTKFSTYRYDTVWFIPWLSKVKKYTFVLCFSCFSNIYGE